ncbi:MAG: toxin-antitoxin system YwqK family antitoxin [Saprospiraceae bacterium]
MNRFSSLLLLHVLTALFIGCETPVEQVSEQDEYGNTATWVRRKDDFARHGLYTVVNAAGTVVETAMFQNDTLHGLRVLFNEKGDTSIVEHYHRGLFTDAYRTYHDNGQLRQKGQYEQNAMTGVWYKYYDNGQLEEEVTFVNNEENGPFREYYRDGTLAAEGSYLNGDNEHGELKLYDERGALKKKMQCDNGRCQTIWLAETAESTPQ